MGLKKTAALIRAIGRTWEGGIILSRDALFFLESGLGISTWQALGDAMGDPGFQDREMIRRIREFEEKLARYSMEYLMLSKYPVPPESIDTISLRLEKLMGCFSWGSHG